MLDRIFLHPCAFFAPYSLAALSWNTMILPIASPSALIIGVAVSMIGTWRPDFWTNQHCLDDLTGCEIDIASLSTNNKATMLGCSAVR
jgi:hypothetical protein